MNMKKIAMLSMLAASLTVTSLVTEPVKAEKLGGKQNWAVTFTADKKMTSNFKSDNMDDVINGMQPGDEASFTLKLTNEYSTGTDWYMTNKVLKSMEDQSANSATAGGAYTYHLTYTNPEGKVTVLFDSDTVGGEESENIIKNAGEGLHEATSALEDFFFLDDLKTGESGQIDLTVALDGETQGNDYQDTLAELQMNFAVELAVENDEPETTKPSRENPTDETTKPNNRGGDREVVKTGDETNMNTYYILAGISGALLLFLGFLSISMRKQEAARARKKSRKGRRRV